MPLADKFSCLCCFLPDNKLPPCHHVQGYVIPTPFLEAQTVVLDGKSPRWVMCRTSYQSHSSF